MVWTDSDSEIGPTCGTDEACALKLGDVGPCRIPFCNATGTCEARPHNEGGRCDDSNPCTAEGICSDGECLAGANSCQCQTEEDCAAHEDGNACNGSLLCQDGLCVVDPTTVVTCVQSSVPACQANVCVPETGACHLASVPDETVCDDDDPCTDNDQCVDGECTGSPRNCNDQNPCTEGDSCVNGACVPGAWVCETCGNGQCVGGETCLTCPEDCGECEDGCCVPHWTSGCEETYTKACVCQAKPECCTGAWSVACVTAVEALHCGSCPALCGDGVCGQSEDCASCSSDCGPCPQSCCWPQPTAGCNEPAIEEFVCKQNPYCCAIAWNAQCVELLHAGWPGFCCGDGFCGLAEECQDCPADCPCSEVCGNGLCQGSEDCTTCPSDCGACPDDCCRSHSAPRCGNATITQVVCAQMPQCCSEAWYPACLQQLLQLMPGSCCGNGECGMGEDCQTCGLDCGLCEESCCNAHEGPGCNNDLVEFITCQIRPECCTSAWSEECATLVLDNAPGSCCGDGACMLPETCDSCPYDCGACFAECGNGVCEVDLGEDCGACHIDCGYCASQCGNSHCEPGETCTNCPNDCGLCHDCCQQHVTTGCEDPEITICVCLEAPECCTQEWSATCALLTDTLGCGLCPGLCGNGECDGQEYCASCPSDCGSCDFDCCVPHPAPGCSDPAVTQAVCSDMPECCEVQWSAACIASLSALMPPYCCGDNLCSPSENVLQCADCAASSDCCAPHASASCADPAVAQCVCAVEPACCTNTWSYRCIDLSTSLGCGACGSRCGDGACSEDEDCAACPMDCGPCLHDCCQPHEGTGCQDPAVQATVCAGDPACCSLKWDNLCANAVDLLLPGTCCGNGACNSNEACSSCPADCGLCTDSCCQAHAGRGCQESSISDLVCASDSLCCSSQWDEACVFELANLAPGFCCGDAHCTEADSCETCPEECGVCPPACCEEHEAPGCSDQYVAACVCQFHPECCQDAWTKSCVIASIELQCNQCTLSCGDGLCFGGEECTTCPQDCGECASDCCSGRTVPGCTDPRAMEVVCGELPFCCNTLWSEACAAALDALLNDYCCGDGKCSAFEECDRCTADCGLCQPICGEKGCEEGETCLTCPADCGECQPLDCPSLAQCVAGCALQATCEEECLAGAAPEAVQKYHELEECVLLSCPDLGQECLDGALAGACGPLFQQCMGCEADCAGRQCGTDGCGGTCGVCPESTLCNAAGLCAPYACGDGQCTAPVEQCASCPQDCGACRTDCCIPNDSHGCIDPLAMFSVCLQNPLCCSDTWGAECVSTLESLRPGYCCGNGFCSHGETCSSCTQDCGPCQPSQCGDGACSVVNAETCSNCPTDCGVCPNLDCWGLIVCADSCTDWPCVWGCLQQGTIQAKARFQELMGCVQPLCPVFDSSCIGTTMQQQCKDKYIACTGCLPQCEGRQCGSDSCKGVCGTCPDEAPICSESGQCLPTTGCGDGYCDADEESCENCSDCGPCIYTECTAYADCLLACDSNDDFCQTQCTAHTQQSVHGLGLAYFACLLAMCPDLDPTCVWGATEGACNTEWSRCECQPMCGNRECGPDSCAGICGLCSAGTTCSWDGFCGPGCGDGACGDGETCKTCPEDCQPCPDSCCLAHEEPGCNDGSTIACLCFQSGHLECCSGPWTEACVLMAMDFGCAYCGPTCGDGLCNSDREDCNSCPQDCGECAHCGDDLCEPLYEDCDSCKKDCGNCP